MREFSVQFRDEGGDALIITNNLTTDRIIEIDFKKVDGKLISNSTMVKFDSSTIGIWGRKRRRFLIIHRNALFHKMLKDGTLTAHLESINKQALEMYDNLVKTMAKTLKVDDKLKAYDEKEYNKQMGMIEYLATEKVENNLINT